MDTDTTFSPGARVVIVLSALVIIIAGTKSASSIISPLLMSIFISIICSAPLFWLHRKGMPKSMALVLILAIVGSVGVAVISLISNSLNEFTLSLPEYKASLLELHAQSADKLGQLSYILTIDGLRSQLDPNVFIKILNYMLSALSNLLGDSLVVFLAVLFILTEISVIPEKFKSAFNKPDNSVEQLTVFTDKVIHYLALKAITSAITAICIAIILWFFDIDYIFLWAVLAFFLNFIPYIGSILAGLPAVLLALLDHGFLVAMWVIIGYFSINIIVGNIIETRLMGDGLNLSSFTVFVSLIFWGWVLGPVGMFLSIPLTMLIMIALESNKDTQGIARLMQN